MPDSVFPSICDSLVSIKPSSVGLSIPEISLFRDFFDDLTALAFWILTVFDAFYALEPLLLPAVIDKPKAQDCTIVKYPLGIKDDSAF
ncbi:hypothetical protein ABG808_05300 [Streptococcus iniae]